MSATDTALRVLEWTTADRHGQPPRGDLDAVAELGVPPGSVLAAIGKLAAVTSARLRLTTPPFGDSTPPGAGAVVLSAVIGGRHRRSVAERVVRAVPMPVSGYDLIVYFGLTSRCLGVLDGTLREDVLRLSPLHGLFDVPAAFTGEDVEFVLENLIEDPAARRMAALRLADLPLTAEQATWRGELFQRFRHGSRAFVLDVYEAALVHFGAEHRARLHEAEQVGGALLAGTARWWRALAELEKSRRDELRARPNLTDYLDGVRFYWRHR